MTDGTDRFFSARGRALPGAAPVSDELLAGYLDGTLPDAERHALETRALTCPATYELIRAAVDAVGVRHPRPESPLRVLVRLVAGGAGRGLELLNPLRLAFEPRGPALALGALRGGAVAADLFRLRGPGGGLDGLELQALPDGSVRLGVTCDSPPAGERLTLVRELDGALAERRPFGGEPVDFAPVPAGETRLRLLARPAGGAERVLSEAVIELRA